MPPLPLLRLAALPLLLALHGAATAAIVIDDTGGGVGFSTQRVDSILVPNVPDRLLLIGVASGSENFIDIRATSVTFNGIELTSIGTTLQQQFTDWFQRTEFFALLDPAPGFGSLSVTVNADNPGGFRQEADWGFFAASLSGAANTLPTLIAHHHLPTSNLTPAIGLNIATVVNDSTLFGLTSLNAGLSAPRLTSNTGVVDLFDVKSADSVFNYGFGYKPVPLAGPTEFSWVTNGFSTGLGILSVVAVEPAAAPIPLPPTLLLLGVPAIWVMARKRAG